MSVAFSTRIDRRNKTWTTRELKEAEWMQVELGWGVTQIGKHLGRSRGSVSAALNRAREDGLIPSQSQPFGRPSAIERRNKVMRILRLQGRKSWEIAEAVGLSHGRAAHILAAQTRAFEKMAQAVAKSD